MAFKFHRRARFNYWSNSKIVEWLDGSNKEDKKTFHSVEEVMVRLAIKGTFFESVAGKLQNLVMFPADLIHSIRIYIKNSKGNTHVLDGGLEKGQWYDLTYRIPHCLFGELVKYIEQEKGLDVLQWEKTLVLDEDMGYSKDDPDHGQPTSQAESAVQQEIVYKWWLANKDRDFYLEAGGDYGNMSLIEAKYEQEETEMLVRLIKVRTSLWT